MLKELIHDKINEIFAEYQKANNIIGGDIEPFDAEYLASLEAHLAQVIEYVCSYQPKEINFDAFTPSWYIYLDCDGEAHSETFNHCCDDKFFKAVSQRICFDDCTDESVVKIYYKGKEVYYAGWQPGMKYEYVTAQGNTVWVGYFEEWDH